MYEIGQICGAIWVSFSVAIPFVVLTVAVHGLVKGQEGCSCCDREVER